MHHVNNATVIGGVWWVMVSLNGGLGAELPVGSRTGPLVWVRDQNSLKLNALLFGPENGSTMATNVVLVLVVVVILGVVVIRFAIC